MSNATKMEGLMKRHLRLINRKCYVFSLYSNVLYEDAVQDVLLEIALKLDALDEDISVNGERLWVINITRRTLRSYKARKEVLGYMPDDWENSYVADIGLDANEIFDELISYMEPDDKNIIIYLMEGYTIKEIATMMDMDKNTLCQRKYRLKNKIKNIYTKLYGTKQ